MTDPFVLKAIVTVFFIALGGGLLVWNRLAKAKQENQN